MDSSRVYGNVFCNYSNERSAAVEREQTSHRNSIEWTKIGPNIIGNLVHDRGGTCPSVDKKVINSINSLGLLE